MITPISNRPKRIYLGGVPADGYVAKQLIDAMVQLAGSDKQSCVSYVNVHVHNLARRIEPLRDHLNGSDICYVDGVGIRLGAWIHGKRLPGRTTAADFLPQFIQTAVENHRSIYLLAGKPGIAQRATHLLRNVVPSFNPVGIQSGYIDDDNHTIAQINAIKPNILIVGMGSPKQELWIKKNRHRIDARLIWSVGALLDYVAEEEKRCPMWIRRLGMEWLYRFSRNPRQRAKRYLLGNPAFLLNALGDRLGDWAVGFQPEKEMRNQIESKVLPTE